MTEQSWRRDFWGLLWESRSGFVPWEKILKLGRSTQEIVEEAFFLEKRGYTLELSPVLGIRLLAPLPDIFCSREWEYRLWISGVPWVTGVAYPVVGSTNEETHRWAEKGAGEGFFVLADAQRQGRGRWGRGWQSPLGLGLYGSILLRPGWEARQATRLAIVATLAAAEAVEETSGQRIDLGWPNDLFLEGRKVGGVLVETRTQGAALQEAVIGLGLNVRQTEEDWDEDLKPVATSLASYVSSPPRRMDLWIAFLHRLYRNYHMDFSLCRARWEARSPMLQRLVRIESPREMFVGMALGLSELGELNVQTVEGRVYSLGPAAVTRVRVTESGI